MTQIIELNDSREVVRSATSASATYRYRLLDYSGEDTAMAALSGYAPSLVDVFGAPCTEREITITPESVDTDHTVYLGVVTWGTVGGGGSGSPAGEGQRPKEPKEPEDPSSIEFSFGNFQDVKLQDYTQKNYSTALWPDTITGINQFHPELPPEGQEYNRALINVTIKTVFSEQQITNEWLKARYAQVWTLNEDEWRGLDAKCVAFTGMSGFQRNEDNSWVITYTLQYRPPSPGAIFATGKATPPLSVDPTTGWQYLWSSHDNMEKQEIQDGDVVDSRVVRTLNGVYVADLYETSDFSLLGIKD